MVRTGAFVGLSVEDQVISGVGAGVVGCELGIVEIEGLGVGATVGSGVASWPNRPPVSRIKIL